MVALSLVLAVLLAHAIFDGAPRRAGAGASSTSGPSARGGLPRPDERVVTTSSGLACRSRDAYRTGMAALREADEPGLRQLVVERRDCALTRSGLEASVLEADPDEWWVKVRLRDREEEAVVYINPPGVERFSE